MIFAITKNDIRNGRAHSSSSCPLALSIKRRHKDKYVGVAKEVLYIGDRHVELPPRAMEFVTRFDSFLKVRPTSIAIDIPASIYL